MKTNRIAAVALLPVALLALSGCGLHSGVAADVGGAEIHTSDVDLLTKVQCREAAAQAASASSTASTTTAISQVRQAALSSLIDSELNKQFAAQQHATYDKDALRTQMTQFESLITALPKSEQDRMRTILQQFTTGQLQMSELGAEALAQQGTPAKPTAQQQSTAGYQLRSDFARKLKITLDPAYGLGKDGAPDPGVSSLSKPVSSFATAAAKQQPTAAWVAGLSASQKCG